MVFYTLVPALPGGDAFRGALRLMVLVCQPRRKLADDDPPPALRRAEDPG